MTESSYAAADKVLEDVMPHAVLGKHHIISHATGYYLETEGRYVGPYKAEQAIVACRDILSEKGIMVRDEKGKLASMPDLAYRYGSTPEKFCMSLVQESHFDEDTKTFVLGCCQWSDLEPAFHPGVDRWLRALGGELYEALEGWLAALPLLERPSSALWLLGDEADGSGTGKGLLTKGLAALWGRDAVDFTTATGKFNGSLAYCPLVVADEGLRVDDGGSTAAFEALKRLVSDSNRTIAQKHVQAVELHGHLRLLITSNNSKVLRDLCKGLTAGDRAALDQRVLMIHTRKEAKAVLDELGNYATTTQWIKEGSIASHVMHLTLEHAAREVGQPESQARFLAAGQGLGQVLIQHDEMISPVTEAVVAALCAVEGREVKGPDLVTFREAVWHENGKVLVHLRALLRIWDRVSDVPRPGGLLDALQAIGHKVDGSVFSCDKSLLRQVAAQVGADVVLEKILAS